MNTPELIVVTPVFEDVEAATRLFGELWQDRVRRLLLASLAVSCSVASAFTGVRVLHAFDGVGHAPMLVQAGQRQVVRDFLLAP